MKDELKKEKEQVLNEIVENIKLVVLDDENFNTHDMLKILAYESKKLIISDF